VAALGLTGLGVGLILIGKAQDWRQGLEQPADFKPDGWFPWGL
jgi:hypothetical protein